jgi:SAM-dependent methyltransferase
VGVASREAKNQGQTQSRIRASYDAIALDYDRNFADELDFKPLDRKLLEAVIELVSEGRIADVGCGPGHVTRFLATLHSDVIGIDISPNMIALAKERTPALTFAVASMLELPAGTGEWAAAVALYSVIHLDPGERAAAWRELARAIRPEGWLLVAFHVSNAEHEVGALKHVSEWFGHAVDLDGYFLDPASVTSELERAGFSVFARMDRVGDPAVESPSTRCYLLAQRRRP